MLLVLSLIAVLLVIPKQTTAQAPDSVVIAESQDIDSGDPQKTISVLTWNPLMNIYDTLVARDAEMQLKPGLALSWQMVEPTVWEFKLRRGVRFHNGEPLNAGAVKFSLERAIDPRTRWSISGLLRPIKTITVVTDSTVRITTDRPWPFLPRFMAYHGYVLPPDYVRRNGDEALARRPVGTGPYKFVQWTKGDRLELEANVNYWAGRPRIGRVTVRPIPDESTRLAELLAGSVQLINLVPPEEFGPIQRSTRAKLVSAQSASLYYLMLNLVNIPRDSPLADKRVRQALNYAIDRKTLIDTVMRGVGSPYGTFCVEFSFGCDPSISPFPYDPERARALLREAGHANGFDMTLSTSNGGYPADLDLTLAVSDQLARVGVRAKVVVGEYNTLLTQARERKLPYDAWFNRITDAIGYAGRAAVTLFHSSRGAVAMWVPGNKEFEDLLDSAEVTLDEGRAKDLYRRAQLLFKDEAPAIVLITAPNAYGMSRRLNWQPRPDLWLTMFDATLNP